MSISGPPSPDQSPAASPARNPGTSPTISPALFSSRQVQPPSLGGYDRFGTAWTGGAPTNALCMDSFRTKPVSLMCTRLGGTEGVRMYNDLVRGNDAKFKPNDGTGITIQLFSNEVNLKLTNYGMDLVFYIPDEDGNMVNIKPDHTRFTMQQVQEIVSNGLASGLYDDFDEDNLADSKMYLLNKIDQTTKQEINPFMSESTTGPELWMRIVGTV
jgi:hypothetical protein